MAWYKNWFDSPYYHLLYQHRNDEEAAQFIDTLIDFLPLNPAQSTWLDTACGKGRHVLRVAGHGFEATGTDLSEQSIQFAQQVAPSNAHFYVRDIRQPLPQTFDVVSNLFTSFGYFEQDEENLNVMKALAQQSKQYVVVDYLNAQQTLANVVTQETIEREQLTFFIQRQVLGQTIIKTIQFKDGGQSYQFEERVRLYTDTEMKSFMQQAGLELVTQWGGYQKESFEVNTSKRLILIAQQSGLR